MSTLTGKHLLVLGLGESGLAMARWAALRGARLRVADSRAEPPGLAQLQLEAPLADIRCGEFGAEVLDGIELVALSPGIDPRHGVVAQARARGLKIVGELTLFVHALEELGVREQTRLIAITGSNGKTTTTTLCAALARAGGVDAVAAGNISPAMLDVLMERLELGLPLPACWVLELSSFQLELAADLQADAATVLNFSADHLDRYNSLADYAAAKARIHVGARVQVLNREDIPASALAEGAGGELCSFGLDAAPTAADYGVGRIDGHAWLMRGGLPLLACEQLKLRGGCNHANALAALALCEAALGLDPLQLLEALRTFPGLPHRVCLIGERADGVSFYDDSKGTNVAATEAALQGFNAPLILIAGGEGKDQDFAPLALALKGRARAVLLIGRAAPQLAAALADRDFAVELCGVLEVAVQRAAELAQPGEIVLLSPACASTDQFRNYIHRGEAFRAAVGTLAGVELK